MEAQQQVKDVAEYIGYGTVFVTAAVAVMRATEPLLRRMLSKRRIVKLEARVERLAAKVHLMLMLHRDAVYICDEVGNNLWVSQPLARMFGMTPEDMRGNGWAGAIEHADRLRAVERWKTAITTGTPYRDEYTINVGDEKRRIVTEAFAHESELSNEVMYYVGYVAPADEAPIDKMVRAHDKLVNVLSASNAALTEQVAELAVKDFQTSKKGFT